MGAHEGEITVSDKQIRLCQTCFNFSISNFLKMQKKNLIHFLKKFGYFYSLNPLYLLIKLKFILLN